MTETTRSVLEVAYKRLEEIANLGDAVDRDTQRSANSRHYGRTIRRRCEELYEELSAVLKREDRDGVA